MVHETIQFHDIAGLVRGAHQGEGLGNQFLGNIRETDAILHVVRAHDDAQVVHPEGRVDPLADVETVETELLFADLEQAERRLERVASARRGRSTRSWWPRSAGCARWWRRCAPAARCAPCRRPRTRPAPTVRLSALTSKPVLYVANVAEGEPLEPPPALAEHARERGARATAVSARLDSELAELDDDEAAAMRAELGVEESGLDDRDPRGVRAARPDHVLHRRARRRRRAPGRSRAAPAPAARPGSVHTDMERGFVAAEITPWEDLVRVGGYTPAREQALRASRAATTRCATATW